MPVRLLVLGRSVRPSAGNHAKPGIAPKPKRDSPMSNRMHHEKRQFADSDRGRIRRDERRSVIAAKRTYCDIYSHEIKG